MSHSPGEWIAETFPVLCRQGRNLICELTGCAARRVFAGTRMSLERSRSARLVELYEAAVADYAGSQDRSEATLHAWSPGLGD